MSRQPPTIVIDPKWSSLSSASDKQQATEDRRWTSKSLEFTRHLSRGFEFFGFHPPSKAASGGSQGTGAAPILILIYFYLLVRYTGVVLIDAIKLSHQLESSGIGHSRWLWRLLAMVEPKRLASLELSWGNPWSSFPNVAMAIYGSAILTLTFELILRPAIERRRRRPIEAPALRFLFEPRAELSHSRARVLTRLEQLSSDSQCVRFSWRLPKRRTISANRQLDESVKVLLGRQLAAWLPDSSASPEIHRKLMVVARRSLVLMSAIALAINLGLICYVTYVSERLKCQQMEDKDVDSRASCSMGDLFGFSDWLALAEMSLGFIIAECCVCVQFFVCIVTLASQFMAIDKLSNQLRQLSLRLARDNQILARNCSSRLELNRWLLSSWIKLNLSTEDHRCNARLVSEQVTSIIGITLMVLLSSLRSISLVPGQRLMLVWYAFLAVPWLGTSFVIVCCSYMFAKTIELERLAWTVLAQLSLRTELMSLAASRLNDNELLLGEDLDRMWRKLVHSSSLSCIELAARPFGVSLTYGRLIQVNFLILTLATLR